MNLHAFKDGDLLHVRLGTDHCATDRYAEVVPLDGHSDAMTLVDVTGRELSGNIVSARLMTDDEIAEWTAYTTDCDGSGAHRAEQEYRRERMKSKGKRRCSRDDCPNPAEPGRDLCAACHDRVGERQDARDGEGLS